jgi:sugar phosphate isomerase/epimerase
MRLKLACADFTFPLLPHHQALQLISMLGLKGVDIGLFEDRSHLQPSSEFRNVRRAARRLKQKLDDNGLVAADLFLQLALDYASRALNHPRPQIQRQAREAFLKTLDYAAGCGGRHITALPGVHFAEERRRDSLARAAEELAWRVEKARAYRIAFAIEPHIGSFADSPRRAAALVQAVPGLTLTLDYGHHYPRGFSEAQIERLIPHSSHFHARGTNKRSGSTSLADNTLDWKRILRVMEESKYQGWIELEYGDNNVTDTVCLRDCLRALAAR